MTFFKFLQSKAYSIIVMLLGIVMLVSPEQPEKAWALMVVKPFSMTTSVKLVQFLNDSFFMLDT